MANKILTKEGEWKTEEELYEEYVSNEHEIASIISFEAFVQLRKKQRYE